MPIEIKELHIKATVVDKKNNQLIDHRDIRKDQEKMKSELLKECVREVLQVLADKKER